ncbi:hypothetical protein BQ8794_90152 [Mesorhizobium prunaredense]|uniref:Uncharacterized protein n=1 Tax=Mesorhizobium prunaredense TaxID=1631249 RepID=A0A1R3VJA0_9HYPH|nr:hypothetical protein BQ8794_90152 [Mesorhizobium prunaredense]
MVGHRRSPPQIWNLVGWRVVPAIPYVGNFATVSRELSTKPLTVFRAGEQAERTKAEHAPDKMLPCSPQPTPRCSKRMQISDSPHKRSRFL